MAVCAHSARTPLRFGESGLLRSTSVTVAQDLFRSLLRDRVAPVLRREGFKGSGQRFQKQTNGTWAVLHFQRSPQYHVAGEVCFTVNLGIASERLRMSRHDWPEGTPPDEGDCALRERIGFLLADRPPADYWWIVDPRTDVDRLAANLTGYLLDAAIPFLQRFPDDEALRDHWLAALDAGEISGPDFLRLTRLTAQIGPTELQRRLHDEALRNELQERWAAEGEALRKTIENLSPRPDAVDRYIRTPRASRLRLSRR